MRILLTGSTGFLGKSLTFRLLEENHTVTVLTTDPVRAKLLFGDKVNYLIWESRENLLLVGNLPDLDAVIHLSGEGVANKRWNEKRKRQIYDSRIRTTRALVEAMAKMAQPPQVFIAASATGFYGDRGDEALTETSPAGNDFLAKLCLDWEMAARELLPATVRLVNLRIGVVLGKGGGILSKVMGPFKWGVGGPLGTGRQWLSWIHLEDLLGLIRFALANENMKGPINAVAPTPVRNADFSSALGRALSRPAICPVPAPALSLMLGEMGRHILSSQRVLPVMASALGFVFQFSDLDLALRDCTGGFGDDGFKLRFEQYLPVAPKILFEFFSDAKNLETLTPSEMKAQVTAEDPPGLGLGTCIDLEIKRFGVPLKWRSQIVEWDSPRCFVDIQLRGPFRLWRHRHRLNESGAGTQIIDDIEYQLPLGGLGSWVVGKKIQQDIEKLFLYRQKILEEVFS